MDASSKPPAFQFYPRDWLSDMEVSAMSLEAQGLYIRLLSHQWIEGSLPDDERLLARLCGVDPRRFRRLWREVGEKFPRSPAEVGEKSARSGKAVRLNLRLNSQREKDTKYRQSQREHGRIGAERRYGVAHRLPHDPGNGVAHSSSPSPSPSRTPPPSSPPIGGAHAREEERQENDANDHVGNQVNAMWQELKLTTPRVYDWLQGGVKVSALSQHFSDDEILEAVRKIARTPKLREWAGTRGPAYLTCQTQSGQLVLEAALTWSEDTSPSAAADTEQPADDRRPGENADDYLLRRHLEREAKDKAEYRRRHPDAPEG